MEECVDFTEEKKLKEKNTRKNTKIHELQKTMKIIRLIIQTISKRMRSCF